METIEKSVEVVNDLITLNNDRVEGFEKALSDLSDSDTDLKALFQEYSSQSRQFSQELTAAVARYDNDVPTGTGIAGTLHRAWIDVKSLFSGKDRAAILAECERGEDAIKKEYQTALNNGELAGDFFSLVSSQAEQINTAHDRIKMLRDSAKA